MCLLKSIIYVLLFISSGKFTIWLNKGKYTNGIFSIPREKNFHLFCAFDYKCFHFYLFHFMFRHIGLRLFLITILLKADSKGALIVVIFPSLSSKYSTSIAIASSTAVFLNYDCCINFNLELIE